MSGVKTTDVTEHSLEAYCALIRYPYTNEISLKVDLEDFAIRGPPNKPFSPTCKRRPAPDGIASPNTLIAITPHSDLAALARLHTTWGEVLQIDDCYKVFELCEHCQGKIKEDLLLICAGCTVPACLLLPGSEREGPAACSGQRYRTVFQEQGPSIRVRRAPTKTPAPVGDTASYVHG